MMLKKYQLLLLLTLSAGSANAAVRGTVMTMDGAALAGARVEAHLPESSEARLDRHLSADPRRPAVAATTTDASGNFTLDVKKIAAVEVSIAKADYEPMTLSMGGDEDAGAIPLRRVAMASGVVTAGGKPVSNARLVFRNFTSEFLATSDTEGKFAVPDPQIWRSSLTVYHDDFAVFTDNLSDRKTYALQLSPGSVVTGRVVGEDGKTPVAGANVMIGPKRSLTAEDGSFSVDHVGPKRAPVVVESGNLVGSDPSDRSNVTIKMVKGGTVSGVVRDAKTQRPLAGATVTLFSPGSVVSTAVTDAKGVFSFQRVAPGRRTLNAAFPNYSFIGMSIDSGTGEAVNRTLSGSQNATIAGTVLDEASKVVPAARISVVPMSDGFGPRFSGLMRESLPYSGPDGRYVARNVPSDEQVEIIAQRKGSPSATVGPFKLSDGEVKRGVTITLPRGFTLSGKVQDRDGKPLAGVVIVPAASEDGPGGGFRQMIIRTRGGSERDSNVETASDGTFVMQLKEGKYDFSFQREGFARKLVRAVPVSANVEPMEVVLDRGVEIVGRVVRTDGSGISDVRLMVIGGNPSSEQISTAADGSFNIPDLNPGPVMLMAMKPDDFIRETRNVEAPATNLIIEVPPGGRVEGRVVEKGSRRPVTQFRVSSSNTAGGRGMMFMGPPMGRNFTSDDGSFVLENVPLGKVDLMVDAAGFVQGKASGLLIEDGKALKELEIELEQGVRVVGKVTGPDGTPLSSVSVREQEPAQTAGVRPGPTPGGMSDGSGDFLIEGVESGDKTFVFQRSGFVTERKTVKVAGKEVRVDARLGKGKDVQGTVIDEQGTPISGANVQAVSGAQDAGYRTARSDSNGVFRFDGLQPGRYTFRANKTGYVMGEAKDIDLDAASAGIRITLSSGGVIFGRVTGLTEEEGRNATVSASGQGNRRSSAPINQDGSYRLEGAPTGSVRVSAGAYSFPATRVSETRVVELSPGGEIQVDLEFKSDVVVRGRVSREGKPVENAMVTFSPKDPKVLTRSATRTATGGIYEITGLERGAYDIDVMDMQRSGSYSTTFQVTGSDTFDIEMRGSRLRGRVVDADTGEAIVEAAISLQRPDQQSGFGPTSAAVSDASGNFAFETVSPGSYRARGQKDRYGQAIADVVITDGQDRDIELKMTRIDGVRLRVVDARDGRALGAFVWIRDGQGRNAYEGNPRPNSDGVLMVPLAPGGYKAMVSANGYAARILGVVVPSQEIRLALTPGGSIHIQSKSSDRETARLMLPSGDVYQRGPFSRAEFVVHPGVTMFDNMAPGSYVLELLDDRGNVKNSFGVAVVEGQVVRVDI